MLAPSSVARDEDDLADLYREIVAVTEGQMPDIMLRMFGLLERWSDLVHHRAELARCPLGTDLRHPSPGSYHVVACDAASAPKSAKVRSLGSAHRRRAAA